jgi:hypothetical protein
MRLRTLLGAIDEAQSAGDLRRDSPVFAVVRNEDADLDSPEAWDAISIVDIETDSDTGAVRFVADASDDAKDISVSSLRSRITTLPNDSLGQDVSVRMVISPHSDPATEEDAPVVEAFGDEHGLGLMLWFGGHEEWLAAQG